MYYSAVQTETPDSFLGLIQLAHIITQQLTESAVATNFPCVHLRPILKKWWNMNLGEEGKSSTNLLLGEIMLLMRATGRQTVPHRAPSATAGCAGLSPFPVCLSVSLGPPRWLSDIVFDCHHSPCEPRVIVISVYP